jgi:hypothetical protein
MEDVIDLYTSFALLDPEGADLLVKAILHLISILGV